MNRSRSLSGCFMLICFTVLLVARPAAARQQAVQRVAVPTALTTLMEGAAKAIAKPDKEALKLLTDGDPARVFPWRFRGGATDASFVKRTWKTATLRAPGSDTWVAVFWDYQPCESQGDHVHRLVKRGETWKLGAEIPETETFGFRIRDHKLGVEFDLPKHVAKFTDTVTVDRVRDDASTLQMRISADFKVNSVTHDNKPLAFAQAGGVLYVTPPAGSRFALDLTYGGASYHPGMFVGNYVTSREVTLTAYWYPVIGRLPATHSVTATVPRGWTAIGQGDSLSKADGEDTSTYAFRMNIPTCYFTLDAGPYFIYARQVNGRTYQVYLTKSDEKRAQKQLDMMDSSFRLFERLWGPYPWDRYTIVETGQPGWPGALEAYSFTTYGQGLIPGDNPHEWGHSWWGGFVPNTYLRDIWNESVTTYSESVYYRHGKGDDSSRAALDKIFWQRAHPGLEQEADRLPLSETWDALYMPCTLVGYTKGGLVLQNLEETVGFDLFQKCLRTLRERFEKSGEAATWTDVEKVVKDVTGSDYGWWFAQWVKRPGLPRLSWSNATVRRSGAEYVVEGDITQTGTPYRLQVPVWLETADGKVVRSTADVEKASTHVRLTAKSTPVRLLLDPEVRLPRLVTNEEMTDTEAPEKALILTTEAGRARAARLDDGERVIKAAKDVKTADLKGKDLVLIGCAETNPIWAKLAAYAPFSVRDGDVTFRGRTYPEASASAFTANPLSPGKTILWLSERAPNVPTTGFCERGNPTRIAIYGPNGDLLDGELALPKAGPTVVEFKR